MAQQHSDALEAAKARTSPAPDGAGDEQAAPLSAPLAPDFDTMTVAEVRRWALLQDPPIIIPRNTKRRPDVIDVAKREIAKREVPLAPGRGPDPRKEAPAPLPDKPEPIPDEVWVVMRPVRLQLGGGGATRLRPGKMLHRRLYDVVDWRKIAFALRDGGMRKVEEA